jgi:MFS family permease
MMLMMLTAFFMPFARPNLLATIFDITLPEVRSTALAIFMFFQLLGSFVAGLLASYLMGRMDLVGMIRWLGVLPWGICVLLLVGVLILLPKEIRQIHRHMAYRSYLESRLAQKRQIHPPK